MSRKKRITQEVNHLITAGAIEFAPVKSSAKCVGVQIDYEDLDTEDVNLSIRQSNNDRQFNVITGASKALQSALPSHTFTLINVVADELRMVFDPGTATTGIIKRIIWIFE